jgi:hypothetical protein
MKDTSTTSLATPGTPHTLEERRAITADVLKLSGHELKKALTARVEQARTVKTDAYADLGDFMHAYNEAIQGCYKDIVHNLASDVSFSFNVFNTLETSDKLKDPFVVTVTVDERKLLFGLDTMESKGYYHLGEQQVADLRQRYAANPDSIAEDITVPLHIVAKRGPHTEFEISRVTRVSATTAFIDAQEDLIKASDPYYAACEALRKAEKDLADLPRNMEELEMQTIAARVQDMGGGDILMSVLDSQARILTGEAVSGLSMTLPDYSKSTKEAPASGE